VSYLFIENVLLVFLSHIFNQYSGLSSLKNLSLWCILQEIEVRHNESHRRLHLFGKTRFAFLPDLLRHA